MICFRDRTFCTAACATVDCDLRLTAEVEAAARRWWGGEGAPICMGNRSASCPDFKPTEPAR